MARPKIAFAFLLLSLASCSNQAPFAPVTSITVTPFQPAKSREPLDWICDALTVEVIENVGRAGALRVTGPVSAFKGGIADPVPTDAILSGEISEQNGVHHIHLKLKRGSRVVLDTTLGRSAEELIRTPDEISGIVLRALNLNASLQGVQPLTGDLEAHIAYWHGLHQRYSSSGSLEQAQKHFEEALHIDPMFATATARLAETRVQLMRSTSEPPVDLDEVRKLAMQAVKRDSNSSVAHLAYAEILFHFDWQWSQAVLQYRDAIQHNPSNAAAHNGLATLLTANRQFSEAAPQLNEAAALEPRDPAIQQQHVWLRFYSRQGVSPSSGLLIAQTESSAGNHAKAVELADAALTKEVTDPINYLYAAQIFKAAGRADRAKEQITKMNSDSPILKACALALMDDRDQAIAQIQRAQLTRHPDMIWIHLLPMLQPLRRDPRAAAIFSQIGSATT